MSLLIKNTPCSSLHFTGILGSGMSAIAQYLHWSSLRISGSDRLVDDESTRYIRSTLESMGCRICKQDGSGVSEQTDAVIVSTAIEESNPDITRARSLNIPVFHRSDALAAIVNSKKSIAVAGTSGKSTVTALVFHLLSACGMSPSIIAGGNLNELVEKGFIGNAWQGSSDLLVIEADESDGSLIKYNPYVSVFLNISKDHKPVEETLNLFQTLARQSSHVFINYDDMVLRAIQPSGSFGMERNAGFSPDTAESGSSFAAIIKNGVRYVIPVPGNYSRYNLAAALTVCRFLGCTEAALAGASCGYRGIQRRFDCIRTRAGVTVIDDYAHNPEKIGAMLDTVLSLSPAVFALFQPHGFTPTKFLQNELIAVFNEKLRTSDTLFLLPIYYAGGTVSKEISSRDIAAGLKTCKAKIFTPENRDEAITHIASEAARGDLVVSMGARDPSLPAFAKSIAQEIDARHE